MIDELASLLVERFTGREDLYALQGADGSYRPVKGEFTPDIARSHLQKALTVGSYVMRRDNTVKFAALDFDDTQYSTPDAMNHAVTYASRVLRHFGIDHILERSGRKGIHLWVFFGLPVEAALTREFFRSVMAQVEAEIGVECAVEIFPKQDRLQMGSDGEPLPGNLIKLPLGIHRVTGKRCLLLDDNLTHFDTMEGQKAALERCGVLTEADLRGFLDEYPAPKDQFRKADLSSNGKRTPVQGKGSVPCTAPMFLAECREGGAGGTGQGRNWRFYDLAVRMLREGVSEDDAITRIIGFNSRKCLPSEDERKVVSTVESVYRGGYAGLRCEENKPFCAGEACAIYRAQHNIPPPGIAEELAEESPQVTITDLVKVDTSPPIWRFRVDGVETQMEGADFLKIQKFRDIVFQTLNKVCGLPLAHPKESLQKAWERYLQPILDSCVIEDAPEEASESGRLRAAIWTWVREDAAQVRVRDEVLNLGTVLVEDPAYPGVVLFRLDSLRRHLDHRKFDRWGQHDVWNILRGMGAKPQTIRVQGKTYKTVALPVTEED